jgi:hypothetical protein
VSACLFEGLNKTIKENQAKKEQEIKKKREQGIREVRIPSHSFFMASTYSKVSWTAAFLRSSASIT